MRYRYVSFATVVSFFVACYALFLGKASLAIFLFLFAIYSHLSANTE